MGKAADNERHKLRATFYNNLSVGLFLGGVFIPYLALTQRADELVFWLLASIKSRQISFTIGSLAKLSTRQLLSVSHFGLVAVSESRQSSRSSRFKTEKKRVKAAN